MSLVEFQRRLAELIVTPTVSEAARHQWRDAAQLDARERRRLDAIAEDPGLETARTIHRYFRGSALTEGIPLSMQAFEPGQIKPLLAAYWEAGAPRSMYTQSESAGFAAFVLDKIEAGELDNPVLADLLRYELADIELQTATPSAVGPCLRLEDPLRQAPLLAPDLRIVHLDHDPNALLTRARRGLALTGIPRTGGPVLLRSPARGQVRAAPLVPQLAELLSACEGTRSAAAIASAHGHDREGLQSLAAAGYVVFVELEPG